MGSNNQPCAHCGRWKNPSPVSVLLVPVDRGVLLIRRNIPPVGKLALPGGFIDLGETWQQAGAREVREEAGVEIDPAGVRHARTVSPPDGSVVLIFGIAPPITGLGDLGAWAPNSEVLERLVVNEPVDLAFPTHTEVLRAWFAGELERG
ncbi:MAG TPA: NUDIX domain-containing protein [Kofleriaceae bacterium]|nr:NUDIX domain-containing protein [Kofleriaceae bacterium]